MSCCGNKRRKLLLESASNREPRNSSRISAETKTKDDPPVNFQYVGKSKLRVIGPKTRNLYRFNQPGAVVAVDPRDQVALTYVPTLRIVGKSSE